MSDRSIIKGLQKGQYGSAGLANIADAVLKANEVVFTAPLDNSSNAAASIGVTPIVRDFAAGAVKRVDIIPSVAVINNDLNFLTFTLAKQTANGTATVIASGNTAVTGGLGNVFAFVPVPLTLTANAVEYAADDLLVFYAVATNNGKAFSAANAVARLVVVVERI